MDIKKDYLQYEINYMVKDSVLCYTEAKTKEHNGPLSFESIGYLNHLGLQIYPLH